MQIALNPIAQSELLKRKLQSVTVELLSVYEELALLYSLGAQIGCLTDEVDIGAIAIHEAIEISSADCGWLAFWNGTNLEIPERCRKQISCQTACQITQHLLLLLQNHGKNEFLCHSLGTERFISRNDAPARLLTCALIRDGKCYGFLCLGRNETREVFLSPDQKLVRALALFVAIHIENGRLHRSELEKQRLMNELQMAKVIQRSLSPGILPQMSFLESAASSEPCYEIGGDFYDLRAIDEASCMLIVADVSGKGPSAALQAAMAQGAIQAILQVRPCLASFLQTLNECLVRCFSANHFLSAFSATIDKKGLLQYVNAGHPAALWITGRKSVLQLSQSDSLLGLFSKVTWASATAQLRPDDIVILYTDGITDAENARGEPFGLARLVNWAGKQYGCT